MEEEEQKEEKNVWDIPIELVLTCDTKFGIRKSILLLELLYKIEDSKEERDNR